MNTDFVTGSRNGTLHVRSDQARSVLARTIGPGAYILAGCAATMTSANVLHIADGYVMAHGAVVQVAAGDISIANGTQGMKRRDLICLSYALANSVETIPLAVVQGTPSTTPADPAVSGSILAGDLSAQIPIWRVSLDGITPTVEQIAATANPLYGDTASGSAIFANDWTVNDFSLEKVGSRVKVHLDATYESHTMLDGSTAIFTVPAGFRPSKPWSTQAVWAATTVDSALLTVGTDGNVKVLAPTLQQRIICDGEWRL